MSWHVTTGERTDALADALADLLATPLPDPLAQEVVVVPAKGMERWLTQRLSHRLGAPEAIGGVPRGGVCAGVWFVTPRSLVATLTGRERDDPWDPDRLVWPLLDVIDTGIDEAWCATIARHLGHGRREDGPDADELADVRAGRRYSLARRLAGLFAAYGVQRPQLLTDWREGRATDGAGAPLDADLAWQPELYRRLLERVDADPPDVRHIDTLARLTAGDPTLDLPGRLSFFGHTRIPRTEIELLAALAAHRDVHLWLPQASQQVWHDLADRCAAGPVRRSDDDTGRLVAHPLLASLGRDSRELQRTLALAGPTAATHDDAPPADTHDPRTTLGWLQRDLRAGRPPSAQERAGRQPAPDNDSVRVHACHGPARQVEVLREVLVGLLADDPTLEPRDIIVLCPDIEAYAPLVQAAFGLGGVDDVAGGGVDGRHPGHGLRVRLADRSLTATNPLAALAADLLRLVGGRMTAGDVLDLAASAPLRRRFAFSDDDLERITRWVEQAAIRWGRDADAREPYRLKQFGQNTWRFGLDRLLLGVASAERHEPGRRSDSPRPDAATDADAEGPAVASGDSTGAATDAVADGGERQAGSASAEPQGTEPAGDAPGEVGQSAQVPGELPGLSVADLLPALPVDDVAGGDIDLVGRLAEFVDRLGAAVERLEQATVAPEWLAGLADGVRDLADVAPTEVWQVAQLDRELAAVAEASSPDTRLRLADVRGLLAHRFGAHPTRANFRTGTLTVATMVPMRSVPHRVVALLGLDDGVFPRHASLDGDDVLARSPLTGERDPRSEDRQLLLDAIMSATDHLVITYTGAGEHTGTPRPPAVPLGELIDAVHATVAEPTRATGHAPAPAPLDAASDARDALAGAASAERPPLVVRHRLQPFAPANFAPGALGARGVFSFDSAALQGALSLTGERTAVPPLLDAPLPPPPAADVDLDDLLSFYAHPVRHFLRTRLDVTAPLEADDPADAMPVALDSLEKWAVGDRLLTDALAGVPPEVAVRAERLRGLLPPGGLAEPVIRDVLDVIGALVRTVRGLRGHDAPHSVDVDVDLGSGRRLAGTVANVYAPPTRSGGAARQVTVTYSSVSAKRRLEAWVTLLALAAGDPGREYTSHAVGRRGGRAVTATITPIDPARAREVLTDLVDVYDRGRCEPLPLAPRTALAYAEAFAAGARGRQADPVVAARVEWEGKDRDAAIPGERADPWHVRAYGTDAPLERLLTPALDGENWNTAPDRLGQYALRVWEPVLAGQVLR